MSLAKQLRGVKPTQLSRAQSLQLWKSVVRIAITSNKYDGVLRSSVMDFLDKSDYASLVKLSGSLVQTEYASAEEHFLAHQLANLIRKYPDLPGLGVNPRTTAEQTFESAEWRCRWVNRRLAAVRQRDVQPFEKERAEAQKYIRYVLRDKSTRSGPEGPLCSFPYDELWSVCDFTGGASIGVHGSSTHLYAKLTQSLREGWSAGSRTFSYAAKALWSNPLLQEWVLTDEWLGPVAPSPHDHRPYCLDEREFIKRLQKMVSVVSYNKVGFVPKTALTDRSIAVEPTLNTFLQKGVDILLRRRLAAVGLDLSDQEPNQHMAFLGSLCWDSENPYCTIDLSSASDTLSIMCAADLLPEEWFAVLDDLRSRYRESGKGVIPYEKFVTMGNGFCFPLQTLIFSSLCVAAYAALGLRPDFRVYGDDIIVRKVVFAKVLELLKFYGFKPNAKKTFGSGPFRESCGGDYFKGTNVRPIIFDKPLEQLQDCFGLHNQTLRSSCQYVKDYFTEVREHLFQFVDESVRLVSSTDPAYTFSGETVDGAFWVEPDVAMGSPFTRWNRDTQSPSYIRLQAVPVVDPYTRREAGARWSVGLLLAALRGSSSAAPFVQRYQVRYMPRVVNPEREYARPRSMWWFVGPPAPPHLARSQGVSKVKT